MDHHQRKHEIENIHEIENSSVQTESLEQERLNDKVLTRIDGTFFKDCIEHQFQNKSSSELEEAIHVPARNSEQYKKAFVKTFMEKSEFPHDLVSLKQISPFLPTVLWFICRQPNRGSLFLLDLPKQVTGHPLRRGCPDDSLVYTPMKGFHWKGFHETTTRNSQCTLYRRGGKVYVVETDGATCSP